MTSRILFRIAALEAVLKPEIKRQAAMDLSLLTDDELDRLTAISERIVMHGEQSLTAADAEAIAVMIAAMEGRAGNA